MDYLKKEDEGESPYEKISDLLLKLFTERPPQKRVYNEYEELVSQLQLKTTKTECEPTETEKVIATYNFKQFEKPTPFNPEEVEENEENEKKEEAEEEQNEPSEHSEGIEHEDLPELSQILEKAGQNFSQIDAFKIETAIHDLAKREEREADKIKFFGKVGPYWLLRAETENYPENEEPEEQALEEEQQEEPKEEVSDRDDELVELREKWQAMKDEAATEEKQENEENQNEPEEKQEISPTEEKVENEESAEEAELDGNKQDNGEVYEEEEPEPENELMNSNLSLDEEFEPESKIPKKVPIYGNKKYPLKKIQKLPMEEHDGVNKDIFFAAIDCTNKYMEDLFCRLEKECDLEEYRKEKHLKQQKSKMSKLIEKILAEPLNFITLPEVTPEEMRVFLQMPAQSIRFTGDLTHTVVSSLPPFNFSEATLLRCCCAKILHDNTVVPKGMYVKDEEEEQTEVKQKIEDLEQLERQRISERYRIMEKYKNSRIYEIMLALPKLWKYSEDEDRMDQEAQFAELNEEYKGQSAELLLKAKQWQYLLPRISGQGKALPVNEQDYEAIDEPEPCELAVQRVLKEKRAAQRNERLAVLRKEHELELQLMQQELKKNAFKKYKEAKEEAWAAEMEEIQNEQSDEEVNVPEDDFDDSEKPEKFALEADTPYEEIAKYYAVRLWRKLRVFERPVDPWDASIVDGRPNCVLPELFIDENELENTRVDFKEKCTYSVDEGYNRNIEDICDQKGNVLSKLPIWRFELIDLEEVGTGPEAVIASNSRCPGAMNVVCGSRMQRHHFIYFGDGLCEEERTIEDFQMPEMCVPPMDITEELEVDPEYERMEYDTIQDKIRKLEEQKRAEEAAAAEEEKEEE